jgi:hypothetical protein
MNSLSPPIRATCPAHLTFLDLIILIQFDEEPCRICGGQNGPGAGFLRVLRFPLPIFIPPISAQSLSPIIRGWYNRPVVAAVPKVPPHKLKKKFDEECSTSS